MYLCTYIKIGCAKIEFHTRVIFILILIKSQWEILAIFGSLQNPDFIETLGPKKLTFLAPFLQIFYESKSGQILPTVPVPVPP